jgi:nucleotidyltransferase/DNA polymerase involved in DNA repair
MSESFGGCYGGGVQVEQVRLGIPTEQPLAVQQWEGLIAVNYAARAAGIVRHERVSEALRKVSFPLHSNKFSYYEPS